MLHYDAFDRFPYRAEWLPHADIQARLRSRNGSVTKPNHMETSCCHVATSDRGCAEGETVSKRKPRKEGA